MKLHNYSSVYFAVILFVIITAWSGLFYYAMLDEIYDSIDDGLDNQKDLVIQKAATDTLLLNRNEFGEAGYRIREIPATGVGELKDVYKDTMMYMQNEKSDEPVRLLKTVFLQNGRYYQLEVATSMVEEDDLVKQLLYSILWLYLGLITTIIIFNSFLIRKIWAPFYQILKQLRLFRIDKPSTLTLTKTPIDEFKDLHEASSKLLHRNLEIYQNQKQFIENAAHELQTPLAVAIGKLETLAEESTLSERSGQLLAETLEHLEQLTRFNRSLLLLSKIDNRQFTEEKQVDLNKIVKKAVSDFEDFSRFREVEIRVKEKTEVLLTMNEELAVILVTNLIKNAIVHNHKNGYVEIVIDKTNFNVENSGEPIPLDGEKIFQRFYATGNDAGSTGLGLAIVHSICKLYGFHLQYYFDRSHHINVSFPH
jgi:signal transduction histidine kinase